MEKFSLAFSLFLLSLLTHGSPEFQVWYIGTDLTTEKLQIKSNFLDVIFTYHSCALSGSPVCDY